MTTCGDGAAAAGFFRSIDMVDRKYKYNVASRRYGALAQVCVAYILLKKK